MLEAISNYTWPLAEVERPPFRTFSSLGGCGFRPLAAHLPTCIIPAGSYHTPMQASESSSAAPFKIKEVSREGGVSGFRKYRSMVYGDASLWAVFKCELITTLFGWIPGALGLVLRQLTYRCIFPNLGKKVVFGKDITIRHPHKIRIGDRVIIDDNAVLDAKGEGNRGLVIGDGVYIGRNTIVYCKNGEITLEDRVNLSSNCQVFSSNDLTIGAGTVVGAFSYFLSGGEYDYADPTPFCEQNGTRTRGALRIGPDCWLAARVTVLDGASIGERCVVGAGAVVTQPLPPRSVAVGVPARVVKTV